jgi:outer membrane protein assembly factor BamD (BamD/ComL family)
MFHDMRYRTLLPLLALIATLSAGCTAFSSKERAYSTKDGFPIFEDDKITRRSDSKGLVGSSTLGQQFKRATGKASDPTGARASYAEAEALFRQAEAAGDGRPRRTAFRKAAGKFVKSAELWPNSEVEQDGLFMAAECYFFSDDYPESNELLERVAKDFPNNRHTDLINARRFRIAQYWLSLIEENDEGFLSFNLTDGQRPWRDTRGNALRIYDKIRLDDPRGKLADDATIAAANAYFQDGKYYMADEYYKDLREAFPNSEHQFLAHYLAIQAKMRSYRGPEYSGAVLDEAEELVKQVWRQFPVEAEKQREELDRAWSEVRHKQAERDWLTAKYYNRQKAYGAAKYQYAHIVKTYEDTAYAQEAQVALSGIANHPDVVEAPFAWLENYVPAKDRPKPLVAAAPSSDTIQR